MGLVAEVRAQLGLTQREFARLLGVSAPQLNRWEQAAKLTAATESLMVAIRSAPAVTVAALAKHRSVPQLKTAGRVNSKFHSTKKRKAPAKSNTADVEAVIEADVEVIENSAGEVVEVVDTNTGEITEVVESVEFENEPAIIASPNKPTPEEPPAVPFMREEDLKVPAELPASEVPAKKEVTKVPNPPAPKKIVLDASGNEVDTEGRHLKPISLPDGYLMIPDQDVMEKRGERAPYFDDRVEGWPEEPRLDDTLPGESFAGDGGPPPNR